MKAYGGVDLWRVDPHLTSALCAFSTLATLSTSIQCNPPKSELTSTVNHLEVLKSVIISTDLISIPICVGEWFAVTDYYYSVIIFLKYSVRMLQEIAGTALVSFQVTGCCWSRTCSDRTASLWLHEMTSMDVIRAARKYAYIRLSLLRLFLLMVLGNSEYSNHPLQHTFKLYY
jgi:hypothetical protein